MNTINNYASQSELAWAAYANLQIGEIFASQLTDKNTADIQQALADSLAARYLVVDILNDTASGAYAVVFEDKATGARTLAIRGTTPSVADIAADTYLLIGVPSNLNPQYQALQAKVSQWQIAGVINASTTLTGHSLGGYLATALKSTTPAALGATYTYNAPGLGSVFGTATQFYQETFGVAAFASGVYDVRGTQGLSFIGGLGQHWGAPVPVEIEAASGAGTGNHVIGRINQPLAVLRLLAQLDPTLTLERGNQMVQAASNQADDTLEKLLNATFGFFNGRSTATATGDDQALYQRLAALQASPAFQSLQGKVLIRPTSGDLRAAARNSFAALVALQDLSPVYINGKDAAADARLASLWQSSRAADYAAWTADKGTSTPTTFTDSWLTDRAAMLGWIVKRNMADDVRTTMDGPDALFRDTTSGTTVRLGSLFTGDEDRQHFLFGSDDSDTLVGGSKADHLYGGAGNDTLNGQGGNDYLEGGVGADTYNFTSSFGKDTVFDADGLGAIQIDGTTIGTAKGIGERGAWAFDLGAGVYAGLAVYDDARSSTGKRLVITKGTDTGNTITIDNFDLTAAQGSQGYLGIKLDNTAKLAIREGGGSNVWGDLSFDPASLTGASAITEGNGKTFILYLNQAAKAGEIITLALSGLADKFKAILGDSIVDANGAVITLAEGQTQVSFALVQQGEVSADASAYLSASYTGADGSATSNAWGVNLSDAGAIAQTYLGDQRAKLIGIETQPGITADKPSFGTYAWNETSWAADGTLTNGVAEADFNDVITGSAGNDKINGLGGNDALDGGAGNDEIDGGAGDDLIGGGAGSDNIKGGAGNDVILSATNLVAPQRLRDNGWSPTLANSGGGAAMDDAPDVIDAGDGDDIVYAGRGDDRIDGGNGADILWGLAGNDIIEGGAGDDQLIGDGSNFVGYYESTPGEMHGNDFLDGGDGNDILLGGGKNDVLFGGSGDDQLVGDASESELAGQYHGNDYLDGEDGNDMLWGGGGDDTLYGGAGNDELQGDADETALSAPFHGNDYLDGEDGDDLLIGGGKDDTLFGGAGDDELQGDANVAYLDAQFHGNDYLDGGDGNDKMFGDGGSDTMYGGAGNDQMFGETGAEIGDAAYIAGQYHGDDYMDGEDGDDYIEGNGGADTIYGGAGNDTIWGDAAANKLAGEFHGADYIDGEDGDDDISGGGGADTLYGGSGDDLIKGDGSGHTPDEAAYLSAQYHGDDYLDGEDGNDQLWGDGGNDILYGGAGNDILYGDNTLDQLAAEFHGNDYLDGGDGDDTLFGGGGNDTLYGGSGNDILIGGAGADYMDGGEGDDSYEAGAGDTVTDESGINTLKLVDGQPYAVSANGADLLLDYGGSGSLLIAGALNGSIDSIDGMALGNWLQGRLNQSVNVTTTRAHQKLSGGSGNDQLTALHGDAIMFGGDGNDTLLGSSGNDIMDGGAGNDVLDAGDGVNQLMGGQGNDLLIAGAGDDTLDGGDGNDTLYGGAGNDTLYGGAGDDVIDGGDGNDVIHAGYGADTLLGGAGMDTYMLGYGMDQVSVADSSEEGSVIQLDASGLHLDNLSAVRRNNDLLVSVLGTDRSMRIKDYYGATQTSWVFKDGDGNALSAQALIDASKPQWDNLLNSLIQEFKVAARGSIGKEYFEQNYIQQADGSWLRPSDFSAEGGAELNNLHQEEEMYSRDGQTQISYSSFWNTNDWRQIYYSTADTTITFADLPASLAGENLILDSMSRSTAYQTAWGAVAWNNYATSLNESFSLSNGANGLELYKFVKTQNWYLGRSNELRFDDPGAAALAGPLPEYVSVQFAHHSLNYNLGETFLADGNHTVWASPNSAVIGGVGDSTIFGAGFAYGGTGNARLMGGGTLMAGAGDQYLQDGQVMVVGDGHDTVVGRSGSRILVDPNNAGMDLITSDVNSDYELMDNIYRSQGVTDWQQSYEYGGLYRLWIPEVYGGYFNSIEEARSAFDENVSWITFDDAISSGSGSLSYVQPLTVLLKTPNSQGIDGLTPSDYYTAHPLETVALAANNFAALQPYFDAELLPTETVSFGPGLSLSDITFSWDEAISPVDGVMHVTLNLQWGPDQGIRVMIPGTRDALDSTVQQFEFADGSTVSLGDLIALAPPAPGFDPGYMQLQTGTGHQAFDATEIPGIYIAANSISDLQVRNEGVDGLDLVISINNGQDSLQLNNWHTGARYQSDILVTLGNGLVLTSRELTSLSLAGQINAGDDTLAGTDGNDVLNGGFGNDYLSGNAGNDILKGGAGDDTLESGEGNNVLEAGVGDDYLYSSGNASSNFMVGGKGFDVVNSGGVNDVIGFNAGDGEDSVYVSNALTFSLGGGISADSLSLRVDGYDVVLDAGNGDAIRFKYLQYYYDTTNLPAMTLQIIAGDIRTYDFNAVLAAWETELAQGGSASNWPLADALATNLFGASGDHVIGGELAYRYAKDGSLNALAPEEMQAILADANFGAVAQLVNVNVAPIVISPLVNQQAVESEAFTYAVPAGTFADLDIGDTLTLSAGLAGGAPLPSWLTFDAASRTFSGTPGSGAVGSVGIQVIASDAAGASASSGFSVNVLPLPVNQTLYADASNTPLYGGAGNDTLYGSWNSSTLIGGPGNDVLIALGGPTNVLDGGAGDDNLTGGWGQDILRGGEGNNTIHANGGNSVISAGAGDDLITSGWGDDQITAGDGNNQINAGGGRNTITAGSGNDVISSEWGDDTIDAGNGNNVISAGEGLNTITSGMGDDVISAQGRNVIHAGAGNDQITTGWGADSIDGGAGDDIIRAGGGGDTVRGGPGNDQIISDQWSDDRYLFARGDGQDLIADGGGQDRLDLEDVRADQLWFSHAGNNLEVSVIGTTDKLSVADWYLGDQYHVEQFKTSDGKTLLDSQVQNLVDAMAAFAPPAAGQTTLAANYATALSPVIVANWT
ncbi:MAG: putative Ig domain-containing protein [Polaromonas sp.]